MWFLLPASLICAAAVLYRYIQVRRTIAGVGWALFIISVGSFGSGLAASFAWSGLVFLFFAALGIMIIVQDAFFRRQANQRRQQSR
jgi:hypothetical protein